jgi:hypothetical protein
VASGDVFNFFGGFGFREEMLAGSHAPTV